MSAIAQATQRNINHHTMYVLSFSFFLLSLLIHWDNIVLYTYWLSILWTLHFWKFCQKKNFRGTLGLLLCPFKSTFSSPGPVCKHASTTRQKKVFCFLYNMHLSVPPTLWELSTSGIGWRSSEQSTTKLCNFCRRGEKKLKTPGKIFTA